ncbi:unnamed protein product [Linum tenue]|uniref:Uncharacterized protein n=1 Tax=Linum tenue TaxID=586396 RepID=A0AAV0LGE6_9ROSI|nr:unnamed protein product [Linum tenue]
MFNHPSRIERSCRRTSVGLGSRLSSGPCRAGF